MKIPQSNSQVITDASHNCTHTGSWINIFFVRLMSLLCLLKKINQVGVGGEGGLDLHDCTTLHG